jgi:hypothetical protein
MSAVLKFLAAWLVLSVVVGLFVGAFMKAGGES